MQKGYKFFPKVSEKTKHIIPTDLRQTVKTMRQDECSISTKNKVQKNRSERDPALYGRLSQEMPKQLKWEKEVVSGNATVSLDIYRFW